MKSLRMSEVLVTEVATRHRSDRGHPHPQPRSVCAEKTVVEQSVCSSSCKWRSCCPSAASVTQSPVGRSTFLLVSCCLRGGLRGDFRLVNPTAMRRLLHFLGCEWFPSAAADSGILTGWVRPLGGSGWRGCQQPCSRGWQILIQETCLCQRRWIPPPCPAPSVCPLWNGDSWAQSLLLADLIYTYQNQQTVQPC